MQNFNEKHPQVIENVRCRCKISEGSILKSQKKQDVDAIIHARQTEKHLRQQINPGYRRNKKFDKPFAECV
ncbi:MAG: hypothetical protein EGQ79_03130 [Ruminococcus sp.]|nr:hypothetical protein [Ruminococcus sp.]